MQWLDSWACLCAVERAWLERLMEEGATQPRQDLQPRQARPIIARSTDYFHRNLEHDRVLDAQQSQDYVIVFNRV